MESLFDNMHDTNKPLADRVRPKSLDDFVGQEHIVGKGKLLRRLIETHRVPSVIFFGATGCGKTTLARIVANSSGSNFVQLNAISSGIADAKAVIDQAKKDFQLYGKRTYLLLDECHRWSKSQQDTLLASLEEGYINLIGSTTENPNYAMNRAIVSRCTIFEFVAIPSIEIAKTLHRVLGSDSVLNKLRISDDGGIDYLSKTCIGDLRIALNALELACLTTTPSDDGVVHLTREIMSECIQQKALNLDEGLFYDITSAFCKSLRGSDPNAALYYSNLLLQAGAEPEYLARRCICHASEDIGMADSNALTVACNALYAIQNLGMPEGNLALSHAIIYICNAPKSNAVYLAMHAAKDDATNHIDYNIPPYLKVAANSFFTDTDGKSIQKRQFQDFACGAVGNTEYKYPHDFGGYVEQQYMPDSLKDRVYYKMQNSKFKIQN